MRQGFDRYPIIGSALGLSAAGALFYNLLPLFLGTAQESLSLTATQTGLIGSAFFVGYIVVTLWAYVWINTTSWRWVTWRALVLALVGLGISVSSTRYEVVLVGSVITGGGFAALYGIGTTVLSYTSNPARWYGVKIACETAPGALLFFLLPMYLVPQFGLPGVGAGMLVFILLLTPLFLWLPDRGPDAVEDAGFTGETTDVIAVLAALLGLFLFFGSISGIWAFAERLGAALDFEPESIGGALAMSLVFAFSGSGITALLGERFGNVYPFLLASLVFVLAMLGLQQGSSFGTYAAACFAVNFAVGMGLPFAIAEVARLDLAGRFVILTVPAIGLGATLGPGIFGAVIDAASFQAVFVIAMCASVVGAGAMVFAKAREA